MLKADKSFRALSVLRRLLIVLVFTLAPPLLFAAASTAPAAPDSVTQPVSQSAASEVIWLSSLYGDPDNPPRQIALNAQTGQAVFEASPPLQRKWTSPDGRWQYFLEPSWSSVKIWAFDSHRGAFTRAFELAPYVYGEPPPSLPDVQLAFSKNGQTIAAIVRSQLQKEDQWQNDVYLADTATGHVTPSLGLGVRKGTPYSPWFKPFLSDDGGMLAVVEGFTPNPLQTATDPARPAKPKGTLWLMNTNERRWRGMIDLSKAIGEFGIGSPQVFFSGDGQTIYYTHNMTWARPTNALSLVAIDVNTKKILHASTFTASAGESAGGCDTDVYLTPDESAIAYHCRHMSGSEPADVFHFLNTRSGEQAGEVTVPWKPAPKVMWGEAQPIWSADGRTIYVMNPDTNELAKVDVDRRAVVARADLNSATAVSNFNLMERLSAMFVRQAIAKPHWPPMPLTLSQDEKRLYLLQGDGRQASKGIWMVDTTTLNVMGHWLAGEPIQDAALSADGRELYVIAGDKQVLIVLDAVSGEKLRGISQPLKWISAFTLD